MEVYRKNVGLCIINKDNLIFAGKRIRVKPELNAWQMPQGGVDSLDNEKILFEGMYKELFEETGLRPKHVEIIHKSEKLKYRFSKQILDRMSKEKYHNYANIVGQEQVWFYLKFVGQDSDINLVNDDHPEFSEWSWKSKEFLIENIIEMKKEVYEKILTPVSKFH